MPLLWSLCFILIWSKPHIRIVRSSLAEANMWRFAGFQLTQLTDPEWPANAKTSSPVYLCHIYTYNNKWECLKCESKLHLHTQKRYTLDTTNTEKVERVTNKMSTKCAVRTEGEEERNVLCFRTKFCRENPTTIFTTLRISQFEGRMVSYHEFTYSLHILKE